MASLIGLLLAQPAGAWSTAASINESRAELAAAVLDGRIYVAGGFDASGVDLSLMEAYDARSDTWTYRRGLPIGLNHLGVAALNGTVYVAGGNVGSTPTRGLLA